MAGMSTSLCGPLAEASDLLSPHSFEKELDRLVSFQPIDSSMQAQSSLSMPMLGPSVAVGAAMARPPVHSQPMASFANPLRMTDKRLLLDTNDDFQLPVKPAHDYALLRHQVTLPGSNFGTAVDQLGFDSNPFATLGFDDYSSNLVFNGMNFSAGQSNRHVGYGTDLAAAGMAFSLPEKKTLPGLGAPNPEGMVLPSQAHRALNGDHRLNQKATVPLSECRPNMKSVELKSGSVPAALDPKNEAVICRILNQLRQMDAHLQTDKLRAPAMPLQSFRLKKDEDDMDDDERLLASEEGKKLTSKERRQLRNKVSARAFRSRRKEYINHLENEVMGKSQEIHQLRLRNSQLAADNSRSQHFIALLLRHPAFQPFLEDLSNDRALIDSLRGIDLPEVPTAADCPSSMVNELSLEPQ